jgi:gliding motility-associated-like protein
VALVLALFKINNMKQQVIALLCALSMTLAGVYAQDCSVYTLTMPADTVICEGGEPVILTPVFTGNIYDVDWSPQAGLDFPGLINPTATVNTTTTYELTVQAVAPENLIFNGDFSMGDVGFTTDYFYGNGGQYGLLTDEGDYAIDDNALDTHDNFAPCTDHTGNGNMMVVNGSGEPDDVWCQTVTVQQNTLYDFSAWVVNVIAENPPNLQFSINGLLLGDEFNSTINTCEWQQFNETWFSANTTSAEICIVNVNQETTGNDFALDDIAFSPVCTYTGEVTIVVDTPPSAPLLNCEATTSSILISWPAVPGADTYTVDLTGASGGEFITATSYLIDGLSPEQEVTFDVSAVSSNGCGTTSSLLCSTLPCPEVSLELNAPTDICEGDDLTFELTINSPEDGPFQLSFSDGQNILNYNNIPSGTSSFTITPEAGFTLELTSVTIADALNCIVDGLPEPVTINVNLQPSAGTSSGFSACNNDDTSLALESLLLAADPGGSWADISTTPAGSAFDPVAATVQLDALSGGLYTFQYTIQAPPGCVDQSVSAEVEILEAPVADAGMDMVINCSGDEVMIGGENTSTGPTLVYNWTELSGTPIDEPGIPAPVIKVEGTYTLEVVDTSNGCTATDIVVVTEQTSAPVLYTSFVAGDCNNPDAGIIQVDSVTNGVEPFLFALNGGAFSSTSVFTGLASGVYTISVIDGNACEGGIDVEIPSFEELFVALQIQGNADGVVYTGEEIVLSATVNRPEDQLLEVNWTPAPDSCGSCLQVSFTPQQSQVYELEITDINGCTAAAELVVMVEQNSRYFIPNAFSPNEDGRNDIFYAFTGSEISSIESLVIMDRWGNMVFQRDDFLPNDATLGWDGTFQGERAKPGVYAYAIVFTFADGRTLKVSGDVSLIR